MSVFTYLRTTDLVLLARASTCFQRLVRISTLRKKDTFLNFEKRHEMLCDGVSIDPAISPNAQHAMVFNRFTKVLQIRHLSSGHLLASTQLLHAMPVSLHFSNSAHFLTICFDSFIKIFACPQHPSHPSKLLITPYRHFRFNVPVIDYLPPGFGRFRYGMGRMFAEFTADDKYLSVAHILDPYTSSPYLTVRYATVAVDCDYTNKTIHRNPAIHPPPIVTSAEEMTTVHVPTDHKYMRLADMRLNPRPLRILVPPGSLCEPGFVLDPSRPDCNSRINIPVFNKEDGHAIDYMFSKCGSFYIEARRREDGNACHISVTTYDLTSMSMLRRARFRTDKTEALEMVLCPESRLCVILMGSIKRYDSCSVFGWHAVDLEHGGMLRVRRTPGPDEETDIEFADEVSLSRDGQFLSLAVATEKPGDVVEVHVYETATGLKKKNISVPYEGTVTYTDDWTSPDRFKCTHVLGTGDSPALTAFTVNDQSAVIAYAN